MNLEGSATDNDVIDIDYFQFTPRRTLFISMDKVTGLLLRLMGSQLNFNVLFLVASAVLCFICGSTCSGNREPIILCEFEDNLEASYSCCST